MIIYIYTSFDNKQLTDLIKNRLILYNKDIVVNIISNLNLNNVSISNNIIIPQGIIHQYEVFHDFYTDNIYSIIDNKMYFYYYLEQNRHLLKGISLIPTYNKTYTGENIHDEFIIKHANGFSSAYNQKKTGYIKDLIKDYGSSHQIQPIIPIKHIYGVNCSCLYGKIIGLFVYESEEISEESFVNGIPSKNYNYIKYDSIKIFVKKIIQQLNYNGFIELEFIIDKNDKIYIMECNPRISGALYIYFYFDWVILPYINCLLNKNVMELDLDDNNKIELESYFPGFDQKIANEKALQELIDNIK
jgi:hypothetical protein